MGCIVIAIFPIHCPGAAIPTGGSAYPGINDPNADFPGYYADITNLLNATSDEVFAPSIGLLDLLIQSMQIIP